MGTLYSLPLFNEFEFKRDLISLGGGKVIRSFTIFISSKSFSGHRFILQNVKIDPSSFLTFNHINSSYNNTRMSKAKEIAAGITYQQLISNNYRPIYIGIFLAVLACLTIRNVLLRIYSKFCKTNNTTTPTSIESISNSTSTKSSIIRVTDHWLQIRLEKAGGFSPIELLISFSVVLVNATLCLVSFGTTSFLLKSLELSLTLTFSFYHFRLLIIKLMVLILFI